MPKQEKGKSHEIRPVSKRAPNWCKYQPEEVEALIVKLAKEGNSPSRIGTILRDQYSVPLAKPIIGKRVMKVLRENFKVSEKIIIEPKEKTITTQ